MNFDGQRNFFPAVDFNKATSGKQQNHPSENFEMAYREKAIRMGVITWAHGINELLREQPNASLVPQTINCSIGGVGKRWKEGQMLIRSVRTLIGLYSSWIAPNSARIRHTCVFRQARRTDKEFVRIPVFLNLTWSGILL